MRNTLLIVLILIFLSSCASSTNLDKAAQQNLSTNRVSESENATRILSKESVEVDAEKLKEQGRQEEIPAAFKKIDFKNFTYPSFHLERRVKLKNGEAESEKDRWSASFGAVKYVDLTNDGKEDAIVELSETSVGVSSSTSISYYIYTIRNAKPLLLWKFQTGSESDCGHKQIQINGKKIILEVFGTCSLKKMSSESYSGDMEATKFTRFIFGWNGKKFVQEKREVFPYPEKDVYKYLYKHTLRKDE